MRRLDNIDIRLLRVFTALADANGFAEAQIALNLSQSTLSTHLADLEKRLGGRLCERGRQQFKLTELGKATYEASMKLFRDLDEFNQRVSVANGNLTGRLRLGACDGIFNTPQLSISRAISEFLPHDSEIFIDLVLGTAPELEQRIADGERDIVIGPLSQRVPGIEYVDYYSEPHNLYCGRGHPLFTVPDDQIDRRDVEAARFSVRRYRHFDDLYYFGHSRAGASIEAMEAQLMLILSGRFIGFLPTHLAEPWVSKGELRPILEKTHSFDSTHTIGYRRQSVGSALVERFLEVLIRMRSETAQGEGTSRRRWK
ncbi:LysR family transcriptional regulator [Rhizobium leguminosarum]|uniref:LysR family transcriptional regulator n=1 Tax=Rhizobium leguminosarum TaxID=384 RepID=A0A6P0B117_RHILE|nr:LysR family transcriptional regulator [Rhizobium leguminosarum]NEI32624.1 LysR family transcriptional regulator [Rhizobium leguminosarum]NEI39383.1 LysR family transcriptional regulator [Rhizobium leguminosarum]